LTQPPENRLAAETSAYLLQHRHNPVDWHPWGEEAFARARSEDRPLLVSIGYSSCHWCHVMEHESFSDPETAALMNRLFVNVKVDREERPDVDQIYMDTVVRLTGHGGWPLTVFCRPDGTPFYGGTYFPDRPRGGMPSFRQVLAAVEQAWRERRNEVDEAAAGILEALARRPEGEAARPPGLETVREASRLLMRGADRTHGGFGGAPKFPTPTSLDLLVTALDFLPEQEATAVAEHCLLTAREMARGGLYDHLAGGFHRYCTDAHWGIPHFEKMLYDQGLLLRFYAELARRSRCPGELLWPMRETIAYMRRELASETGGFRASQDADAEGAEGRFHVWTPAQIEAVLGARATDFCAAYDVTAAGNFEHGQSHLVDRARRPREDFAAERAELLTARSRRVPPATDPKCIAAWNAYAISGLARASSVLDDEAILAEALRAADFVLREMVDEKGRLLRIHDRGRAHVPGFLDDHAALLEACLDLHRAGAPDAFLSVALHLAGQIEERFFDVETGSLFLTPSDGERLVHRPRSDHDGATPSAAGLAALALVRVAQISGWQQFEELARSVIADHALELERVPHAHPTLLRAVALLSRGLSVAVVVGDPAAPDTRALAGRARRVLLPDDAVVVVAPGADAPRGLDPTWVRGRTAVGGRATAYVCRGSRCSLPVQDPEKLDHELLPSHEEQA